MSRKIASSGREFYSAQPHYKILLTLRLESDGKSQISVLVTDLISYSQELSFTKVILSGGRTLDVKETTDQIDRLMRLAFTSPGFAAASG